MNDKKIKYIDIVSADNTESLIDEVYKKLEKEPNWQLAGPMTTSSDHMSDITYIKYHMTLVLYE